MVQDCTNHFLPSHKRMPYVCIRACVFNYHKYQSKYSYLYFGVLTLKDQFYSHFKIQHILRLWVQLYRELARRFVPLVYKSHTKQKSGIRFARERCVISSVLVGLATIYTICYTFSNSIFYLQNAVKYKLNLFQYYSDETSSL